jgi:RNA polymerase sigma-70 factor (ECF subfamily)
MEGQDTSRMPTEEADRRGHRDVATARLERFARDGSGRLYGLLLRATGNAETARDLLQETLMDAFRKLDAYDASLPLENWVFRIGQNRLRNFLRRQRLERKWMEPLAGDPISPESDAHEARDGELLERALLRLPGVQRVAVLLRYQEDLTCAEIGAVLGMTPNAVSIQLHRARRALKGLLRELTGGRRP